jgi:hypothetical protein
MQRQVFIAVALLGVAACGDGAPASDSGAAAPQAVTIPAATPARVAAGALKGVPWLLGTFRGVGVDGTAQDPFYERYSLADDSTLIVKSFKDSTLAVATDSTRFELRRDSLSSIGTSRYVATAISADSIAFGPLVGVRNGFVWRRGDDSSWTAVIIPLTNPSAPTRTYRMVRIK